ncbi:DUF6308 family protein [Actinoplanes ianthinogenes]|uniref:DUF6308 family protein n=1 Tax=Actinoplanes ianthinogenes TaxID=122358 RepID=UPI001671352B|nr:DUF6308 family protein [Actinoplanes ianthinogenes]
MVRERIRGVLAVAGIEKLVAAYFAPDGPFAGETFDLLGENPPDRITHDDLLATTLLDISWRPRAVRILHERGDEVRTLLDALPTGVDLWQAGAAVLKAATVLHEWLDGLPGVGPVIAAKLLARKRPRLVPIHDEVVLRALAPPPNQFWVTLGGALRDPALRDEIESLRPDGVASPSVLRLLDVAIWMLHGGSGNAKDARSAAGITANDLGTEA